MSEKLSAPLPSHAGAKAAEKTDQALAGGAAAAQSPGAPAKVVGSPALFGGHKGGGKKRLDRLPAGSPEAKAVDNEKARLRMANKRAAERLASASALPPPLPSKNSGAGDSPASASAGVAAVPVPVAGVVDSAAAAQTVGFVPWTAIVLRKPVKLLTKIIDRARIWQLTKRVRALKLDAVKEKEILDALAWKEAAVNDFNEALALVAELELNKRRVPGAEQSHFVTLAIAGGELAFQHFQTLETLERLALENRQVPADQAAQKN